MSVFSSFNLRAGQQLVSGELRVYRPRADTINEAREAENSVPFEVNARFALGGWNRAYAKKFPAKRSVVTRVATANQEFA